jgi:hypothetical protein
MVVDVCMLLHTITIHLTLLCGIFIEGFVLHECCKPLHCLFWLLLFTSIIHFHYHVASSLKSLLRINYNLAQWFRHGQVYGSSMSSKCGSLCCHVCVVVVVVDVARDFILYVIWGSYRVVIADSCLLGWEAVWLGEWLRTFRKNVVPASSVSRGRRLNHRPLHKVWLSTDFNEIRCSFNGNMYRYWIPNFTLLVPETPKLRVPNHLLP